jgi:hypothetical protein
MSIVIGLIDYNHNLIFIESSSLCSFFMNKEIIIQQIESLLRTLNFIQEEQSYVKYKLSNFLENIYGTVHLNWAEILHQEILNRETAIQLLKSDILKLQLQIVQKKVINNILDKGIIDVFKKMKQQVGYIETEFMRWKNVANENFEAV